MKVNFSKLIREERGYHLNTDRAWQFAFLLDIIGNNTNLAARQKELEINHTPGTDTEVDVTVAVNGHEVSFENFIERMHAQYSKHINEAAKDLVTNKVAKLSGLLSDLEKSATEMILEVETRHGVSPDWVLSQLAGMHFTNSTGRDAYDYLKELFAGDRENVRKEIEERHEVSED